MLFGIFTAVPLCYHPIKYLLFLLKHCVLMVLPSFLIAYHFSYNFSTIYSIEHLFQVDNSHERALVYPSVLLPLSSPKCLSGDSRAEGPCDIRRHAMDWAAVPAGGSSPLSGIGVFVVLTVSLSILQV